MMHLTATRHTGPHNEKYSAGLSSPSALPLACVLSALLVLSGPALGESTVEEILNEVADPLSQIERQIETEEYDFAIQWLQGHVSEIERSAKDLKS